MNSRGTAAPEPSGRQSCLVVCGRGPALFPTLGHSHVGLQNNPSCTEPLQHMSFKATMPNPASKLHLPSKLTKCSLLSILPNWLPNSTNKSSLYWRCEHMATDSFCIFPLMPKKEGDTFLLPFLPPKREKSRIPPCAHFSINPNPPGVPSSARTKAGTVFHPEPLQN